MKQTNYVAVAMSPIMKEPQDYHIYSKNSPDKGVMIEYAKIMQSRYPHKRVCVMTYGKAREYQVKFYNWRKEQEEQKLARCDANLNKLLTRSTYNESTKRVAER